MLRRDRLLRTQLYQIKDAALFALGLWIAYLIRASLELSVLESRGLQPFGNFAWLYIIIIPGVPLILELQGFYQRPLLSSRMVTGWLLFKGCVFVTLGIIVVLFLLNMKDLNRSVIICFGIVSYVLVFLSEELLHWGYKSTYGQSQLRKRVMLVGAAEDTARLKRELSSKNDESLEVVAEADINECTIDQIVKLLHERSPNGVILNAKHTYFGQIEKAIQACELEGVDVWLVADFFRTQISRTSFDDFYGRPVIVFRSIPEYSWQGIVKQLIDVCGAMFLILFLSPFLIGAALAIHFTSPGPILFRQRRCGLNGRPFTMLKFRSMVTDAEQRKMELAVLNEMTGPVFKVTNDPRITAVGRRLRKWSIDEFPQLFNVLRGEMSLVGPRPLPVDEVERFDDPAHRRRLSVKPGLTCLWQVSGRNKICDFREWVRLDLEYIDNWSLWLDLKILWRTVPVVLVGTGAK
ncbi:MAG TPA: sugar transferase [Candidatus Binatia bacterium]|nr:sugar transferase [Candidatus Binatia bacterium]